MKYKNFFASLLLAITLGLSAGCATTGGADSQSGYETPSATHAQTASGQETASSDSDDDAEMGTGWKILAYILGFALGAAVGGG